MDLSEEQQRRIDAIIEAYRDGLDSGEANNLSDNPHPLGTEEHYAWRAGEIDGYGRQEAYRKDHL